MLFQAIAPYAVGRRHSVDIAGLRLEYWETPVGLLAYLCCVNLPHHVGRTEDGKLFVSEDVPTDYRKFMLLHEHAKANLTSLQVQDRSPEASKRELAEVPADMLPEYAAFRSRQLAAELATYADEQTPAARGLRASVSFWKNHCPAVPA